MREQAENNIPVTGKRKFRLWGKSGSGMRKEQLRCQGNEFIC